MKTSKFKILIATLALMLLSVFALAQGHRGPHGDGMFGGPDMEFFTDYLDLTASQQTQMKDTLAKEKPALKPLMEQEFQSHQQMMQLIQSGSFDEAKAQQIAVQESATHIQLEVQKARIHAELYQMLTPDQKTKMNQLMAKHQQRMQQHMREHEQQQSPSNQ
ncbi:MAG: Spy/CpxP family protein refolding chaperone [Acidobacteriota bacterium]|nr:Spy/CpxP family protein refolding chaperone [Acidobacteriota bacterium]